MYSIQQTNQILTLGLNQNYCCMFGHASVGTHWVIGSKIGIPFLFSEIFNFSIVRRTRMHCQSLFSTSQVKQYGLLFMTKDTKSKNDRPRIVSFYSPLIEQNDNSNVPYSDSTNEFRFIQENFSILINLTRWSSKMLFRFWVSAFHRECREGKYHSLTWAQLASRLCYRYSKLQIYLMKESRKKEICRTWGSFLVVSSEHIDSKKQHNKIFLL